jgi:hypothetical protein
MESSGTCGQWLRRILGRGRVPQWADPRFEKMSSRRHGLVVLWRLGERLAFRVASGNIAANQQTGTKLLRDITSVIDGREKVS